MLLSNASPIPDAAGEAASPVQRVRIFEHLDEDSARQGHLFFRGVSDTVFRQQESIFLAFNIVTLLALAGILLAFRPWMKDADFGLAVVLFLVRAIEQCGEWLYLRYRTRPLSDKQIRAYAHASIWSNIAFAAIVSLIASTDEAHYMVLLLLPVIAACFRYTFPGLLLVITVSSVLEFLELVIFYWRFPPMESEHFFEMATMVLIYPVIGVVAWLLLSRIRDHERRLSMALAELNQTRDRLVNEEKHAAIGRLASSMAHEIRNPVAMIMSALDGERHENPDYGKSEYQQIAAREAARLERLTTDFLAYARSKPPDWSCVPVASTLDYVERLSVGRAESRRLRTVLRCDPQLEASMDEFLVHQALLNLTLNAIEHTPPEGSIVLGAALEDAALTLYVENSGPAIPKAFVDRLFEPFFTTRPDGTGLGLAISQRIAERHGGSLTLARNEDGAVRFAIAIPQDRAEAPS